MPKLSDPFPWECATPDCFGLTNHSSHLCLICRQRREAQFAAEDALGDAMALQGRSTTACDDQWAEERVDAIGQNGNEGLHYQMPGREAVAAYERALAKLEGEAQRSKYHREIVTGVWVDVYDVLAAWGVDNPALQHLVKKALQTGQRGHKTRKEDLDDIIDSAYRAKELEQ